MKTLQHTFNRLLYKEHLPEKFSIVTKLINEEYALKINSALEKMRFDKLYKICMLPTERCAGFRSVGELYNDPSGLSSLVKGTGKKVHMKLPDIAIAYSIGECDINAYPELQTFGDSFPNKDNDESTTFLTFKAKTEDGECGASAPAPAP